jgi:hypothetical protein
MTVNNREGDNILEVMDKLLDTYHAFNDVLKGSNVVHKVLAASKMREMHKLLGERLKSYSQTYANIDKEDHELIEAKVFEFKQVGEKVKEIEALMGKTDKLMDKFYPVKTQAAKKKRARRVNFNKKLIRD